MEIVLFDIVISHDDTIIDTPDVSVSDTLSTRVTGLTNMELVELEIYCLLCKPV